MALRPPDRMRYRQRIKNLVKNPPTSAEGFDSEIQTHWAKYNCVLISGFMEQAVKEMLLEYASNNASPRIIKYVEGTWPESKNMKCDAIREILRNFDSNWEKNFENWLESNERKKEINEIISWRNAVAHGQEANARNVSLASVTQKFRIACDLVDFIDKLLQPGTA